MSFTYDQRKRPQAKDNSPPPKDTISNTPNFSALMNGTARPTAAQKGQPFDLDAAMKAKMENAFGDLSAVKFYKSQAVGDAGAEAIAQGNEIAFAPGMADFSTRAGQERLGHELSHVMSQRSGQVRGSGFLNNASLEARADREGAMAAAGQQIYTEPVTHALSDAAPSPFVAGAMQAKRGKTETLSPEEARKQQASKDADELFRIENGLKTNVSDSERRKIMNRYDDILHTGTNIELLRELRRRREGHMHALVKKHGAETQFTQERKDRQAHPENYNGAEKLKPGDDEYRARFFGGWDDNAMDMGTYGQLISVVGGNGPAGMEAYQQLLQEERETASNKSEEQRQMEQRANDLYGGLDSNPMSNTEEGKMLAAKYMRHQQKRAKKIYRKKKL